MKKYLTSIIIILVGSIFATEIETYITHYQYEIETESDFVKTDGSWIGTNIEQQIADKNIGIFLGWEQINFKNHKNHEAHLKWDHKEIFVKFPLYFDFNFAFKKVFFDFDYEDHFISSNYLQLNREDEFGKLKTELELGYGNTKKNDYDVIAFTPVNTEIEITTFQAKLSPNYEVISNLNVYGNLYFLYREDSDFVKTNSLIADYNLSYSINYFTIFTGFKQGNSYLLNSFEGKYFNSSTNELLKGFNIGFEKNEAWKRWSWTLKYSYNEYANYESQNYLLAVKFKI